MLDLAAVPTLETARLRLRRPEAADLEPLHAMLADPAVARWLGGVVPDREQAWRALALSLGHWTLRGYGPLAVEERAGGRLVGRVGLFFPAGWPGIELGWTIARPFWGLGYAGEAARAVRAWARAELQLKAPISLIVPENWRSRRVAEKLGAAIERRIELRGLPVDIWRHPAA